MAIAGKSEILAKFRPDPKVKEGAVFGPEYMRTKAAVQFFDEVKKEENARKKAYEKALEKYRPYAEKVHMSEDDRFLMVEVGEDLDGMIKGISAFHAALAAAQGYARVERVLELIAELSSNEENDGLKNGVDALRQVIQEDASLLAVTVSSTDPEPGANGP